MLRPPRASDLAEIVAACADPEIGRFVPFVPVPYTTDDGRRFLEATERQNSETDERTFAITSRAEGEFLGVITVRLREHGSIGYWLKREARGRGVMTEAVEAIVKWAMHEHGLNSLSLAAHPDNLASQRVAEKAGFTRSGVVPHGVAFRDGVTVAVRFDISRVPLPPRSPDRTEQRSRVDAGAVRVRAATRADVPEIARVHTHSAHAAYGDLAPEDDAELTRRLTNWSRMLDEPSCSSFVAEAEGKIVGVLSVGPARNTPGAGELYVLYVHPDWWGRGAGQQLIERAHDELARSFSTAVLSVFARNPRAQRFYERNGWRLDRIVTERHFGQAAEIARYSKSLRPVGPTRPD